MVDGKAQLPANASHAEASRDNPALRLAAFIVGSIQVR